MKPTNPLTPGAPLPGLPVLRSLGGCGGTLVTRVLAALPGMVVLSETNPRSAALYGGRLNPIVQVRRWAPALADCVADFDEHEIGYPPRFGDLIERLHAAATTRGLTLAIRDFNYADFVGVPYLWPVPMDLSLDRAVSGRFAIAPIRLVRHPADQLASLRHHRALRRVLTADRFLDGYRGFLRATRGTPLFRYEDLVADPPGVFPRLCAGLGLAWDPAALERFSAVAAVTGNLVRRGESEIRPPTPSVETARAADELRPFRAYDELLGELDYPAR